MVQCACSFIGFGLSPSNWGNEQPSMTDDDTAAPDTSDVEAVLELGLLTAEDKEPKGVGKRLPC